MAMYFVYALITIFFSTFVKSLNTCYRPDGTAAGEAYTPCNVQTPFSMCWRSQDAGIGPPDSACYPNGLALSGDLHWRQGCE